MASTMLAAMEILPIGYRFHPSDDELLQHYLRRKNLGLGDPICVIPELDLCRWEPEDLPAKFRELSIIKAKDEEYWFFCEQNTGRHAQRSTSGGFWKKTGKTREVKSRDGKHVIGQKRILPFHRGNCSNNTATDWVMHEYLLPINALDGLVPDNRKNYVLCMVKRNLGKHDDSNLSREFGCGEPMVDISSILELAPDNGFHPEELIQAKMRSLEGLCRDPVHGVDQNPENMEVFSNHFYGSSDSSRSPLSFGRESIDFTSSFSSETSDTLACINGMLIDDYDEHSARMADTVETLHHEQQDFIMQSKQMPTVESCHGFVPIDEKKGIVEDDSDESTASSVQVKTLQQKIKKETPKHFQYVPPTDAKAGKITAVKINEMIASACSSTNAIHKSRQSAERLEKQMHPAISTPKKAIASVMVLNEQEKSAQGKKPIIAKRKPVSSSSPCSSRKSSCNSHSSEHMWNVLVSIVVLLAIVFEIFNL